ncbi:MAG TPA: DUF6265 family protein [Gemmataceae bacterium]|nr:DUF6265 family protein [Gemmataceae bacterium]
MKAHVLLACGAAVAVIAFGWSAGAAGQPKPIDWQKRADEARWDFDYLPHTLAACIERNVERRYEVTTRPEEPEGRSYGILIRFSREGKAAYEFKGHAATPFVITGDRLIYSNHFPGASGAEVVAIDLTTGREVWRTQLQGLGPIEHSAYRNDVALRLADGGVFVYGQESMGGYIEVLDPQTGKTVGHRTLTHRNPTPLPQSPNTLYLHHWAEPPKATLADVAWLAGRYEGKWSTGGHPCQMAWSAPIGDTMTGMFTLSMDGKHIYSEFCTIRERNGSLVLRVRQFDDTPRFDPNAPEHRERKLAKVEKDAVYFNDRTFRRGKDGSLTAFAVVHEANLSVREDVFSLSPAADRR